MNITEIKAIDDLIINLSFSIGLSLDQTESGYNVTFLDSIEDNITNFNNSVDTAFFKFCSILKK